MRTFLLFCLALPLIYTPLPAQSNQDCLDCHDDPEFTMERAGKEILLHVGPADYAASPHGNTKCIDCHTGFDPYEEPHKEIITPVDCSPCHKTAAKVFARGNHAGELSCTTCHDNLHKPPKKLALLMSCESCHENAVADFAGSIHAAGSDRLDCVSCHSPHEAEIAGTDNCLSCHNNGPADGTAPTAQQEAHLAMMSDYQKSVHAGSIECSDCHTGHRIFPADDERSTVHHGNLTGTCNECHEDVTAEFLTSEHGKVLQSGFAGAPSCNDCHGEHNIFAITDSLSRMSRQHEIEVCLSCHLDNEAVRNRMTHSAGFVAGYEKSIHGRAHAEGNEDAAICSDCHGAHKAMKASNPNSPVNKFNVSATCGGCHDDEAHEFGRSSHGDALARGNNDAPTCTDCHGEHEIIEPEQSRSPVAAANVSREVCGPCHSSVKLAEKYGFSSNRFSAYNDSYHGLAVQFGDVEAANCASCHGVHDILPSSDPRSMIHKSNLAATCGQCHPGANENFTKGKVHITGERRDDELLYWISTIYILIIGITIGGMTIHNIFDWIRKMRSKYEERYSAPSYLVSEKRSIHHIRMSLDERIQHWLLIISFFALVITGFILKFPDAWWVMLFRRAGGEYLFELRGLLHRIAAVIMVGVTVYHVYYLIATARGRRFLYHMRLRFQDARDFVEMQRYNLGASKDKPKFDRFNYIEKAEYWALVWGTVIMTLTGFALWFENQTMGWFSKLFLDACEAIHYYEAWLAFLAIVVWHLYYVIFNPDVYPMNFTWLTGKVSEEEMEEEHPLELARIKAEQQAAQASQKDDEASQKDDEASQKDDEPDDR